MPKITMAFQVIPKVKEDAEIYPVVDEAIKVVQKSGLPYVIGPMETSLEGELDEILDVIKEAMEACVKAGASRVMTHIKVDYVPQGSTIEEKISKYRTK
jgi:uncharacterized protein (TIGR00106 family)